MPRILYQIPGDLRAGPLGGAELDRRLALLQGWAAADTVVEIADAPGGPLSIESAAEEASCVAPTISALRRRTFGRWPQDSHAACAGEAFFYLGKFDLNFFANQRERHKNHEIPHSGHAFSAKRDVINRHDSAIAD